MLNLNIAIPQRISQRYRRLDPWIIDNGKSWYHEAHAEAEKLGREYGISTDKASAIIAVLSPGASWERNLIDARAVLIDGEDAVITTYKQNKMKALNILKHDYYHHFIGGKKVQSFYNNIANPDGANSVTLDRHMLRFMLKTDDDRILRKVFASRKKYEWLAEEIRRKARREGLTPCQLQAMLWLQVRPGNN